MRAAEGGASFLSETWFEQLRSRVGEMPVDGEPLRLGVVVTDVPEEIAAQRELGYILRLGGGEPGSVEVGSVEEAEVVLVESFADASRLASGDLDAAGLLESGRIKLRGDVKRLVEATETLAAIGGRLG